MNALRTAGLSLIWLTVAGCGDWGPDAVDVWRQRVPGSSAVIYHVDASYNNTISGSYDSGLVITDSTEAFSYGGFGELTPYAVISGVSHAKVKFVTYTEFPGGLNNDTVTVRFTQPLQSEWTRVGNIDVENARYRGRVGGVPCRLQEYGFARFEESTDSLVVYDLARRDSVVLERKAFPKGDIKATLSSSGFVERLEVEEFVTGVYPGYRTSGPFELVDIPTACIATYWLSRTGPERQRISDYGVFKPFTSCALKENC